MTEKQNEEFIALGLKYLRWAVFAFFARLAIIQISQGAALEANSYLSYILWIFYAFATVYGLKAIELLLLRGLWPRYRFRKDGPRPFQKLPHGSLFDFSISNVSGSEQ